MKRIICTLLIAALTAACLCFPSAAEEKAAPERRMTPIMGWSSWNFFATGISEDIIRGQMDALVSTGLAAKGYTYANIDDGWQNGRDDGRVNCKSHLFPQGMKYLADYVHSLGLKAGMYTDAGETTCGWYNDEYTTDPKVGLYGHDDEDLNMYFTEWGYDFIKVDWCGGGALDLDIETRYTEIGEKIKEIEKKLGKDLIYNICCWNFPGEWAQDEADSWRIHGDIAPSFDSILLQIDDAEKVSKYCGPGHYNDLDMLQVGNGMSYDEDKSHFSMWCMMCSPLLIGTDLTGMSDETLSILGNEELIAVDQDADCVSATVAASGDGWQIWSKPLSDTNTVAVALLNRSDTQRDITLDWSTLGFGGVSSVRDLWLHQDIAVGDSYTASVPAHGIVVLKVTGSPVCGDSSFCLTSDSEAYAGDIALNGGDWLIPSLGEKSRGYTRISEISRDGCEVSAAANSCSWLSGYNEESGITYDTLSCGAYRFAVKVSEGVRKLSLYLSGDAASVTVTLDGRTLSRTGAGGGSVCSFMLGGAGKEASVTVTPARDGEKALIRAVTLSDAAVAKTEYSAALLLDTPSPVILPEPARVYDPSEAAVRGVAHGAQNTGSMVYRSNTTPLALTESGDSFTYTFLPDEKAYRVYDVYFAVSDVTATVVLSTGEVMTVAPGSGGIKRLRLCVLGGRQISAEIRVSSVTSDGAQLCLIGAVESGEAFAEETCSQSGGVFNIDVDLMCSSGGASVYAALYDTSDHFVKALMCSRSESEKYTGSCAVEDGFCGFVRVYCWELGVPVAPAGFDIIPQPDLPSAFDRVVGPVKAHALVAAGAVLLDVRSAGEFAAEHIEGSINLPFAEVADKASDALPDKDAVIITYCSASKRSIQAASDLIRLGYKNVYVLGAMSNWYADINVRFPSDTPGVLTAGDAVDVLWSDYSGDDAEVYISVGGDSSLDDAVPLSSFTVPDIKEAHITLKAYLVSGGISFADTEKTFAMLYDGLIDVYASDLEWTENVSGWSTTRRDRSVENNVLTVGGKEYAKGIGTHADSRTTMAIPEGMTRFVAVAGHDGEVLASADSAKIRFIVQLDGVEVYDSGILNTAQTAFADIPLGDAKTITLIADKSNDNNYFDHADWADAGFIK